ncbi:hypothetical protein MK079_03085 [Candidatus Gracilibacteria bacterium]|nr:hypothetical protein [Candidatus Gracilibacteria bacterium]
MKQKKVIHNSVFSLIAFGLSFLLGFFRSFVSFLGGKKSRKNIFFSFLDFVFRRWPQSFWKKPSFYKLFCLPADLLNYVFKK